MRLLSGSLLTTPNHDVHCFVSQRILYVSQLATVIMDASSLARLSPELRNRIYEFALFRPEGVLIPFSRSNRSYLPRSPNAQLALTTVCREVRAETKLLFYAVNTFVLQTHASDPGIFLDIKEHDLRQWLNIFGPGRIQVLGGVSLHLGTFEDNNTRLADLGEALARVRRQLTTHACETVGAESLHIAFDLDAGFTHPVRGLSEGVNQ